MPLIAFLVHIIGSFLILALIIDALVLIVAPSHGRRMLKRTGAFVAISIAAIILLSNLLHAISATTLVAATALISTSAHFIREHRLGHSGRRQIVLRADRTPVMPPYADEDHE